MLLPRTRLLSAILITIISAACTASAQAQHPDSTLLRTILRQDSMLFTAFNSCDTLALARFFADDIEFYHDKAGLTVGPQRTLAPVNERCRRIARGEAPTLTRVRLAESDAVYPIPGLGAMQLGRHRFIQGPYHGQAPASAVFGFAQVWVRRDTTWQLSRVLSYGHQ